jgi:aspartyl-tRNA(Asn)/glutamyl-tRNA(Gln) amidotransferase subunit C
MRMPLTRAEVRHVAMLARLALEPGDEEFYAEQLSGILAHIDRLQQLDTESIPPTAQVVEVTNTLREDIPRPCLSQEEALANAPAAVDGFFRVPAIQDEA